MMQVNFREAGVIGKETSVRRRESKFGKGEGICREEKSKTNDYLSIPSITSITRWTYRKEPPHSLSSLVRIQFAMTNVELVLFAPIIIIVLLKSIAGRQP